VRDERESGELQVLEHYEVRDLFRREGTNLKVAVFGARQLLGWLGAGLAQARSQPYGIPGAHGEFTYELTVRVASGVSGREDPLTATLETPQFRLATARSFRGDTLRFRADLSVRAEALAPREVAEYLESLKKAEQRLLGIMVLSPENMVASAAEKAKPFAVRLREELEGRAAAAGKAIDAGRLGEEEVAAAYAERGTARTALGDLRGALSDLNAAVRLRPSKGEYLAGRAGVHLRAGSLQLAEADFTRALSLGADSAMTYLRRGHVRYMQARYKDAREDFDKSERANESGVNREFTFIWQALAAMHLGQDPRPLLEGKLKTTDVKRWPVPVMQLLAGRARPEDVLRAAEGSDADERTANLCEAYFYLALAMRARGSKETGEIENLLRKTLDTGVLTYMEYGLAEEALRALAR
jgi:lipoprotein NlpI